MAAAMRIVLFSEIGANSEVTNDGHEQNYQYALHLNGGRVGRPGRNNDSIFDGQGVTFSSKTKWIIF